MLYNLIFFFIQVKYILVTLTKIVTRVLPLFRKNFQSA